MSLRPPATIRPATLADRPAIIAALAAAFQDDPALSWLFADAATRPERLRRFFKLITAADARPGDWHVAERDGQVQGAALWRPPGHWAIPTSAMLANLPGLISCFGGTLPRALGMQAQMDRHHLQAPHWYLQFVGVHPAAQGQGLGGAVIRAGLARADAARQPCYLETATPANVPLYEALGFAVAKTYDIKAGPHFWSMPRPAA